MYGQKRLGVGRGGWGPREDHKPEVQTRTVLTGSDESAPMSSAEGLPPAATISAPKTAIMAPLSVHRFGRGVRSEMPSSAARSASSARNRALAATPPPISRSVAPVAMQASMALVLRTSHTAS